MPSESDRLTEIDEGKFGDELVASASVHVEAERLRQHEFEEYVETTLKFAPSGRWLDIGCGTGQLITLAQQHGIECDGIELNRERRDLAKQLTSERIFDQPLEQLDIPNAHYAAVTMINVFSHLVTPSDTFAKIHQVLKPGGVLLIHTGEVGPGAQAKHSFSWSLGDHLHWLGDSTIERYASHHGFAIVSHSKQWSPELVFSRERMSTKGRSSSRNRIKSVITQTPGVFPALRWSMLNIVHRNNPIHTSTIVLQRDAI
jgi:SAM-dependent methyltransferase